MPTKRELRLQRQAEASQSFNVKEEKTSFSRFSINKYFLWGGLGSVILVGLIVFFIYAGQPAPFDITTSCVTQENYHIHPHLTIIINGQQVVIPEGIGKTAQCYRWLHTHDNLGTIHLEAPYKQDLTLGEFFKVWGKDFSQNSVLGYKTDSTHNLSMTVDGQPSQEWGNLVLLDKQNIVLTYAEKKP